jgi:hypothetical protein
MQEKKDILFIAYAYPPIKTIGVFRSYYVSKYSKPHFDNTFVISTTNYKYMPQEPLNTEGVQISRAYTFDYRTLLSLRQKKSVHLPEGFKKKYALKYILKLIYSFPFNVLFGEGGFLYILNAFFIGMRLIRKNNICIIYSSFSPYSDHIVANLLKFFYPNIQWVADFRDLHVEPHYDLVYWKRFQHWCNKQILKKANLVTTVSDGLAHHLKAYHPHIHAFKNGIPPLQRHHNEMTTPPQYFSKFTVAYTGSMFGDERNPILFFEVISDLIKRNIFTKDNFQIIYAGKDTAIWHMWVEKFNLNDFFISKGMVSLAEAQDIQKQAHINLLLTSATKDWTGIMTGKIYEYLSARNPILVLIDGTQDIEYETFISNLNAGIVGYNDRSFGAVKAFIQEKYDEWKKNGTVQSTIIEDKLKVMTWENVVEKLWQKLDKK